MGTMGGVEVKIISVRADGNYVAKYQDVIYRDVHRSELAGLKGCSDKVCVNDKAIHVGTMGGVKVKVIAIRADGNFVAKYEDVTYRDVSRFELAVTKGCLDDICVGDKAIHLQTLGAVTVKVIGIRKDGDFVAQHGDVVYKSVSRNDLGTI